MRVRAVSGLLLASLAAACGTSAPTTEPLPQLGISNGTSLTVVLMVNGEAVGRVLPGGPSPTFDPADLPDLPWTVEARTTTGRVLTTMRVEPGQVGQTTRPDGGIEAVSTMGRVDLSCGRLTIWAGPFQPSGPPPPPSPGTPGDCEP